MRNDLAQGADGIPDASAKMDTAERSQVTVMFTDLVGSTALSARMDTEDLREIQSFSMPDPQSRLSGLFLGFDLDDEVNIVSDCP
jgi:hypothetical protein